MLLPMTKATVTRMGSVDGKPMNSNATTLASNNGHDGHATMNSRKHSNAGLCKTYPTCSGRVTAVKKLTHILRLAVLAAGLIYVAPPVIADPQIEIGFETDAADSQKLIHAKAVFAAPQPVVYNIFNCITTYPMLHNWIRETTLVSTGKENQEFLVKFAFPWPVGRQWSQVEVRHSGNTIFWRQVDGSLKANHGRISFTTVDSEVHIDYRASIDIGLPELWTQPYKEKFIREFLAAAYEQTITADPPAALALSAEP
jgi:uncharacterized membrane protein